MRACVCARTLHSYYAKSYTRVLPLKNLFLFYLSDWDPLFQLLKMILKPDSVN